MILLALDWEEQIIKAFKEHKRGRNCYYGCVKCMGKYTAAAQIKGIYKEILAGRARVTETLAVDTILMNGGLE